MKTNTTAHPYNIIEEDEDEREATQKLRRTVIPWMGRSIEAWCPMFSVEEGSTENPLGSLKLPLNKQECKTKHQQNRRQKMDLLDIYYIIPVVAFSTYA